MLFCDLLAVSKSAVMFFLGPCFVRRILRPCFVRRFLRPCFVRRWLVALGSVLFVLFGATVDQIMSDR